MAIANKGTLGTSLNTGNNQVSTTHTTATTTVAVGDLAVLIIAVDNNGTGDGDEGAVTSVTSTGNTWLKAVEWANGNGSAQAGAVCSIWYTVCTQQMNVATAITINFSNNASRDESCSTGWCYTRTGPGIIVQAINVSSSDAVTDIGTSLDVSTPNLEHLRVRGIASELNDVTQMTATDGTWTLFEVTRSANVATAISVRGEWKINTGTGAASDPTLVIASSDHAHGYAAFRVIDDGGIFNADRNFETKRGLSDKAGSKSHLAFFDPTDPIFIPPVVESPTGWQQAFVTDLGRNIIKPAAIAMAMVAAVPLAPEAPAAVTMAGAASSATIINSILVYDPVAAPVFTPSAAVATPSAFGYQTIEPFTKPLRKRISEPFAWSSGVIAVTPSAFGYQTVDPYFKPIRKRVAEPFAFAPQSVIAVATPSEFGYQSVEPFAKPIRKKLAEPFAWSSGAIAVTPLAFGYQTVEPYAKPIRKRIAEPFALAPQGFVAVATPSAFGYQTVEPYAKPLTKNLSEPFAAPVSSPAAAAAVTGVFGASETTIRATWLVYDPVSAPIFTGVVVTTPTALGYQPSDNPFQRDLFKKPQSPSAFVFAIPVDDIGWLTYDHDFKPIRKRVSEPFSWPPQRIVVATPSAFGYQTIEPYAKPVRKKVSEPFAWDPRAFVPTPSAFGYQTVEPYAKPIRKKLAEPFAWDPQTIVVVVNTPTDWDFEDLEPFAKPIRKKIAEPFAWDPQAIFVRTPSEFGYQTSDAFAKPIRKKVAEPFAWDPQFIVVVANVPSDFGFDDAKPFAKPIPKKLSEPFAWDPQSIFVPTPSVFGYQISDAYAKPIKKKVAEPFAWSSGAIAVTPLAFGYQTVEPYAKPIRKKVSEPFSWSSGAIAFTPRFFGYQTVEPYAKPIKKKLSEPFIWAPQQFVFTATPTDFGYWSVEPNRLRRDRVHARFASWGDVPFISIAPPSPIPPVARRPTLGLGSAETARRGTEEFNRDNTQNERRDNTSRTRKA